MATFGIHGAVDQFSDLPDPSRFDLQTTFIVRQDTGAPHGAGLYRVQLQDGAYFWDFFDPLSMQRADEVPYDNQASGLAAENLQQAVDLLATGSTGSRTPGQVVYIDPVQGVDANGRGSAGKPYRTVNYAYEQTPVVAAGLASVDGQKQWAQEKLIFDLAPGEYTEDIVLGLKRARIELRGDGVRILGGITLQARFADIPAAYTGSQAGWADNPFPWTSNMVSPVLEINGFGGGMEAGHVTQNFLVRDAVRVVLQTGGGSWMGKVGALYAMFNRVMLKGGVIATDDGLGGAFDSPSVTVEVNDSAVEGGIIGSVRTAASSSINLVLKAANSQLKSVLGPVCNIFEIDNCRIRNLDRTVDATGLTGQVTYGDIQSNTSSAYTGIINCGFEGTVCAIGNSGSMRAFRLDAVSWSNLQARGGITNGGAGINLILADVANGVGYDGAYDQTDVWSGAAPVNLQDAVQRMAVALRAQINAAIP